MKVYFVSWLDYNEDYFGSVEKCKKFLTRSEAKQFADELFDCGYAIKMKVGKE